VIETLLTSVRSGRIDVSDGAAADVEAILGDVIARSNSWYRTPVFAIEYPAETTEAFCDGHVHGARVPALRLNLPRATKTP
jgi:hypothetical protein